MFVVRCVLFAVCRLLFCLCCGCSVFHFVCVFACCLLLRVVCSARLSVVWCMYFVVCVCVACCGFCVVCCGLCVVLLCGDCGASFVVVCCSLIVVCCC